MQAVATKQAAQVISNASAPVGVGNRNVYLTSVAGALSKKGLLQAAIDSALQSINASHFASPLPTYEVQRIAASVSRYNQTYSSADIIKTLNDVGNAERLVGNYGEDLRFVSELKGWYVWDGSMWVRDAARVQLQEFSKMIARAIFDEVSFHGDNIDIAKAIAKHASNTHNLIRLNNMLEIASRDPVVAISASILDQHVMLFGVANGVIDLYTGKIRPYLRSDLITQHSPVMFDAEAKCPIFWQFMWRITRIFDGIKNPKIRKKKQLELILYLRRMIGYCLTGKTDSQVMFFFYGSGANGKSTLLNVILKLLGHAMAKQTPSETLMSSFGQSKATNDLAGLQRARVVTANEIEDGSFLSENLVKQMTGSDPISCRFLYAEFFEYIPQFKLFICGNHKPVIRGTDNGIWRRIQLVPFLVTIPEGERDPNLGNKLQAELSGILNWALVGCREWQKKGLKPPKVITAAVDEYREEMDILGSWISERCEVGIDKTVKASDAYENYEFWARANGLKPMANTAFGRRIVERKFTKTRGSAGYVYHGLELKPRLYDNWVCVNN